MATPSLADAISVLRNPADAAAHANALKHIKNEVVGHVERKASLVRHGIVDVIANVLGNLAKSRGKRKSYEPNGLSNGHAGPTLWSDEDQVRHQAILLLASLAHEGPEFVSPILAGSIIPQLAAVLSPAANSPKLVLASLRTLLALPTASRITSPAAESFVQSPSADILYLKSTVQDFAEILAQKSHSSIIQAQVAAVCQIISLTCVTDHQRGVLLSGGVLDLLAARLAAYRSQAFYWPSSNPLPAASLLPPSRRTLGCLLGAIVAIVENSKYRVARLLYSPALVGFFPFQLSSGGYDPVPYIPAYSPPHFFRALDIPLPRMPNSTFNHKSENGFSKAFPPLGSGQPMPKSQTSLMDLGTDSPHQKGLSFHADESTLIPWLFHTIRSHKSLARVQAAHLLTVIYRVGLLDSTRERMLAALVVPLLTSIDDNLPSIQPGAASKEDLCDLQVARELSRFVLAKLIQPSKALQVAATSAPTMKQVCQTLRETFEAIPIPTLTWSPEKYKSIEVPPDAPPSCSLGLPSIPGALASAFKKREGALLLLAAIADREDTCRKYFTDKGMTQFIIDSMKPFDQSAFAAAATEDSGARKSKINVYEIGNPDFLLIAACIAARALSRSVSLLRTSLIDAGMAAPTFTLLSHPNVEVLKAATDVACNLLVEFSPMRQDLVEAGAIKTLCEHAHSADSEIRLISLWALKHLVHQAPIEIKTSCFEELGPGWLIQIVTGGSGASNTRDSRPSSTISMGAANAAGERVDILNAADEPMNNADDELGADAAIASSTSTGEDIAVGLLFPRRDPENLARFALGAHAQKLRYFKEDDESSVTLEALMTELAIQQQGLDYIRNFLVAPGAAEMVDCLFETLGASCVFDIVAGKLKPTSLGDMPTSPSILQSSVMILTHIAAGAPRHRQQLISQPALIQAVLPLMTHAEPMIRVAAVWMVNNITWMEDQSDVASARQRATELRRLGFEDKLRAMRDDANVDVQERVKTGIEQLAGLLDLANGGASAGSRTMR